MHITHCDLFGLRRDNTVFFKIYHNCLEGKRVELIQHKNTHTLSPYLFWHMALNFDGKRVVQVQ